LVARPADPHAKDALAAAARSEFVKKGLRGARVEDITAACGLSKGSFYLHFSSKEKLFAELVQGFEQRMRAATGARLLAMREFHEHEGALTREDLADGSPRLRRLVELEMAHDLASLECMWAFRDVVHVLFAGAQGSEFEGTVWALVEAEERRVSLEFAELQGQGACRDDISPEVFATLIVGTYVRVIQRMAGMVEKPDLASWARSLQELIREGSAPRDAGRTPQHAVANPTH
jgi:AcrR family transcriptional regulator